MGRRAMELLMRRIESPEETQGDTPISLRAELRIRESTAPPPLPKTEAPILPFVQ
jgi:DNA-binding LacI/PurR family transcriptional regulator